MPIDIKDKKDCVGCNACVQRCPKQCIAMNRDEQGFLYPKVDLSLCINCGLCERVCPVINRKEPTEPLAAYAACNRNRNVMEHSSSGGVFHALGRKTIQDGGVAFGARFAEDWSVRHDFTESEEGLRAFQTSKYLQSRIGDSFLKAESFLKEGRKVLFTGTPCQIAGLKLFLRKGYGDLLLTVDVACHGVPSPMVWQEYLNAVRHTGRFPDGSAESLSADSSDPESGNRITHVSFRDRRNGWDRYGMAITLENPETDVRTNLYQPQPENLYMKAFLKDLIIRPSCFECPAKAGRSGSDLTIADFWGIKREYPELYQQGKYSLVLAHSEKGKRILSELNETEASQVEASVAIRHNPALVKCPGQPKNYHSFWENFQIEGIRAIPPALRQLRTSFTARILRKIKRAIRKLIG